MAPENHLNWIDAALLSLSLFGFILGVVHGLLWQLARLGGTILALIISTKFYKPLSDSLVRHEMASPDVSNLAAYGILFCVVLGSVMLITAAIEKVVKKANLQPMNRVLGGLAGMLKLVLIFGFILWAIKRNHIAPLEESVDRSMLGPKLVAGMELAAGKIPPSMTDKVNKAVPGLLPPKSTTPEEEEPPLEQGGTPKK